MKKYTSLYQDGYGAVGEGNLSERLSLKLIRTTRRILDEHPRKLSTDLEKVQAYLVLKIGKFPLVIWNLICGYTNEKI